MGRKFTLVFLFFLNLRLSNLPKFAIYLLELFNTWLAYMYTLTLLQSLTITVVSYMGKLKVALGVEKGFINSQLLNSYMKESFERILEAAKGKRN